ncbi:MAG: hypothetical protein RL173_2739 [Fibrobacterota bacterium]|jgi:hypothetical protein
MKKRHHWSLPSTIFALATATFAAPKTLVVSATEASATHNSIQAAVNACSPTDNCTIQLVDPSYMLERPIWVVEKANIAIEGATKTGAKPKLSYVAALTALVANPLTGNRVQTAVRKVFTIPYLTEQDGSPCEGAATNCSADPHRPSGWNMWPYKAATSMDTPINSLGDKSDITTPYSKTGYQLNGMVVVMRSQDIALRGIVLDGVRPMHFENTAVWAQKYNILSGSTGLNIFKSLRVTLQDCEVKSFFAAIRIMGDSARTIRPVASSPSSTGGHLFERNRIHDNWWAFTDEFERDLPSIIRYNVAWNNINKSIQYGDSLKENSTLSAEMENHTGGFMYSFDSVVASHKIHNNTLHKHGIVFGFGGWGGSRFVHDFHSNVLTEPVDSLGSGTGAVRYSVDFRQLLQYGGATIRDNTFELEGGVKIGTRTLTQSQIVDDTIPDPNSPGKFCGKGCWVNHEPVKVITQIQPEFLWNGWGIQKGGSFPVYFTDNSEKRWGPISVYNNNTIDSTGLISKMAYNIKDSSLWKANQNMYAIHLPLQSRVSGEVSFLHPDWAAKEVTKTVRMRGLRQDTTKIAADRGAFCWDETLNKTILGECTTGTSSNRSRAIAIQNRASKTGLQSALGKWDPKGRPSVRFMKLPR